MEIKLSAFAKACSDVYYVADCDSNGDKIMTFQPVPGLLCVVFAGTHDASDVVADISAWPTLSGIDYGFNSVWNRVSDRVDALIKEEMSKDPTIIDFMFSGHSLGGAISQLAATKYKKGSITFGSPKVWTSYNFGKRPLWHIRTASRQDPVTMVPPGIYKHWQTKENILDASGIPDVDHHRIARYQELTDSYTLNLTALNNVFYPN